jgi:low affinity Fe/Cu permease
MLSRRLTNKHSHQKGALERLSRTATEWTGSSWALGSALAVIVVWAFLGPVFAFSDTWQLVINTGTTIITFLMVFLIQRTQNKDNEAVQLKLNELVAALGGASNRLINVEALSESELKNLHQHFALLAQLAAQEKSMTASHTIEEAESRHQRKVSRRAERK